MVDPYRQGIYLPVHWAFNPVATVLLPTGWLAGYFRGMKNDIPKIERNVPVPKRKGKGKYSTLADSMEAGDSIVVPSAKDANILRVMFRNRGFRMAARPLGEGKYRCWKLP